MNIVQFHTNFSIIFFTKTLKDEIFELRRRRIFVYDSKCYKIWNVKVIFSEKVMEVVQIPVTDQPPFFLSLSVSLTTYYVHIESPFRSFI
jgi:hypothetical protein